MIFEIISGGKKLTGWGKNGPAYFFPGERMGRPILSPGKKLTGGKFWPVTPEFPKTFFFMPNRSSEQVLESSRKTERLVEHSRINNVVFYLAYDVIVVS